MTVILYDFPNYCVRPEWELARSALIELPPVEIPLQAKRKASSIETTT
jgi:hypothetical protein